MTKLQRDIWSEWLLRRRFGGDAEQMKAQMVGLHRVRDKVLERTSLKDGEILLDVGCGDGLIAFGALERSNTVRVVFADISQDLLHHAQDTAQKLGAFNRCQFICAPADNLSAMPNDSVDVVTTRSVLIYVQAKQHAFSEFYRVLRPEGRISIFEPINQFAVPEQPHRFLGYDVTPIAELAQKVKAVYQHRQPIESDPMFDFDERDLVAFTEQAGFREIHLELQIEVKPKNKQANWDTMLRMALNPKLPTLEEAMQEALSYTERQAFTSHLRPLVDTGQGINREASAYLWATK